ncbi:MAG: DUF1573 domain-containing protein [Prolixibacteraceae bacterium]
MKFFPAIVTLMFLYGCTGTKNRDAGQHEKNTGTATVAFQEEFHNFGSLVAGEVAVYSFALNNTGTTALIIQKAETDCGCVTIDYPDTAIKPGETGYLDVTFNSSGETGKIYKEIIVTTNAAGEKEVKLSITAQVKNDMINIYSKD